MCSDVAIKVSGLSKSYQIYSRPEDRLAQFIIPKIRGALSLPPKNYFHEFCALDDVSFEVRRGEAFGIVGRNGSGKSTLLQLICGTLNPTAGVIQTNGRVAALLELGSGFNPEFTGRENVYLNATVLGLKNSEINARFSEIEKFADIGEFIDQPVKTYSSGMFVRLAFAVIAHVDADILVVDEALSVGDAIFTQKCMRFIRKFRERGTLLFVSHDTGAVQNICDKALWLSQGSIQAAGSSKEVCEHYLRYTLQEIQGASIVLNEIENISNEAEANNLDSVVDYGSQVEVRNNILESGGWKTGAAELIDISMNSLDNPDASIFEGGEHVQLTINAKANDPINNPILGFLFKDRLGQDLFGENTLPYTEIKPVSIDAGVCFRAVFRFQLPMLPNGEYAIMASVADGDLYNNIQHHWLHRALVVRVSSSLVRWGLVGIPFQKVSLELVNE